ncbi:MAG TPA: CPBP family intramembrane glutamic endopeptidase [Myxococcaceae bacterium]
MTDHRRWLMDEEGRPRTGWRVLAYLLMFAFSGAAAGMLGHSLRSAAPRWLSGAVVTLVGGGLCVIGFRVLRARMDRRPWSWIGLDASARTFATLATGLSTGVLMVGALLALEWALGWVEPTRVVGSATVSAVLGSLFAALGIGLLEELLLRGAMLQNLGERLPLWAATLVTGLVFGLLHLANPAQRVSAAFVASAAVATLMLVLARFATGSLGWAIGWHAGWDWMQDVLGIASPGEERAHQLIRIAQHGPVLWTGEAPSIEGGLLPILLLGAVAAGFWGVQVWRGDRWSWRRPLSEGEPRHASAGVKSRGPAAVGE